MKSYWNEFYTHPDENISNASQFAKHVADELITDWTILDVGCGNWRVCNYFAKRGHHVTAVDTACSHCRDSALVHIIQEDVLEYLKRTSCRYDVIYMRWILHALPKPVQCEVVKHASRCLSELGCIWIENRSINDHVLLAHSTYDDEDGSHTTSHKRWPASQEEFLSMFEHSNASIVFLDESRGFSPSGSRDYNTDPLLFRIKAMRKDDAQLAAASSD